MFRSLRTPRLQLDCKIHGIIPFGMDCSCVAFGKKYQERFQNLTFKDCSEVSNCDIKIPYSETFNQTQDQYQIVLGRFSVLSEYGLYQKCCSQLEHLVALNIKDWSLQENNCFIDCVAKWVYAESPIWFSRNTRAYQYYFPVRIYLDDWINKDTSRHINKETITAREICMLLDFYNFRFFRPYKTSPVLKRKDRTILFARGPYVAAFESTREFKKRFKEVSKKQLLKPT